MSTSSRTVNLAGREIGCSCHACAFFHNDDQFYKVLLPFIREGFTAGDRAVHTSIRGSAIVISRRLRRRESTRNTDRTAGNSRCDRWEDAYLRKGHFDQDAMLALIQEALEDGRRQKFPMTRLVANMEWALEDRPAVRDIVAYESRLNYILPKYDDTVVCTSGGQVRIAVTCEEAVATLSVSDTGIGIHPDFIPHVFERFRQAGAEPTTGLGLGLAIVKNLVELHGGTVAAASDGIGRGSRFTVTLPRARTAP